MAEPVSTSGSITTGDPQSVELNDILGHNTVSVYIQGTWTGGQLFFQKKMLNSEWFIAQGMNAFALDGQIASDTTVSGEFKIPITGYTDFRVIGATESGTAEVFMSACEGVDVIQQVLSYTYIKLASDEKPLPVSVIA